MELLNINRCVVYFFGVTGLFYDLNWAYLISMTLWIWLPVFVHGERRLYDCCCKKMKRRVGDA